MLVGVGRRLSFVLSAPDVYFLDPKVFHFTEGVSVLQFFTVVTLFLGSELMFTSDRGESGVISEVILDLNIDRGSGVLFRLPW